MGFVVGNGNVFTGWKESGTVYVPSGGSYIINAFKENGLPEGWDYQYFY